MTTNEKAGLALVIASVVAAAAMTQHPSGRDILDSAVAGGQNARDIAVHLIAIAGELTLLLGTLALTAALPAQRDLAVSAFVIYSAAIFCLIIAAVASGLIAPSLAGQLADAQAPAQDAMRTMFSFNGHINQTFARLGFGLASVAIAMWSLAMVRAGFSRSLGVYGMAAGSLIIAALLTSQSRF